MSQLLPAKPTKHDMASFGGTSSVAMPKTWCIMQIFNGFGETSPSGRRATREKGPNDDLFGMSRR